jgi:hypothetical protein
MKENQMLKIRNTVVTTILLVCFGFLPRAQAVLPPPDGGYPGQNTAEGQSALLHLTSGTYNTAVGWASLGFNVTGNYNTGVGAATLLNNTAHENTAVGAGALVTNTTGLRNTATGAFALSGNITGSDNTASGDKALFTNTAGDGNTAIGTFALRNNTEGGGNTAVGFGALLSNGDQGGNTAGGFDALLNNTLCCNTAVGWHALLNSTVGGSNTAIGYFALGNATSSSNSALNSSAGLNVTTASNVICIDAGGANVSDSCFIGNIWSQPGGSQAVYINSDGKLGAQVSSRRFKNNIIPMEQASEVIYELKPVSFRYKPEIEPTRPLAFGLIAEEVEEVNADLVTRDRHGKPLSVRYDQVNAMLLNEFLKEHKRIEEQQATIADLKSSVAQQEKAFQSKITAQQRQIDALSSNLRKVSAQLDLQKPGARAIAKY